jgi:predicted enzyme related to lactoylglutathione lyase
MHIQFAELPVFDQDRAKSFYVEHFGCQIAADQPHGTEWVAMDRAEIQQCRNDTAFPSA